MTDQELLERTAKVAGFTNFEYASPESGKRQRGAADVALLILLSMIPSWITLFSPSPKVEARCWVGYIHTSNGNQVLDKEGKGIPCVVVEEK